MRHLRSRRANRSFRQSSAPPHACQWAAVPAVSLGRSRPNQWDGHVEQLEPIASALDGNCGTVSSDNHRNCSVRVSIRVYRTEQAQRQVVAQTLDGGIEGRLATSVAEIAKSTGKDPATSLNPSPITSTPKGIGSVLLATMTLYTRKCGGAFGDDKS